MASSSSLSGRGFTSIRRSSSSESTQPTAENAQASADPRLEKVFVPHVYDFVSIHQPAYFRVSSRVPSLYLEPLAVDQSLIVGHGASFTTFKRAIPDAPEISQTSNMDGWSVRIPKLHHSRPKHVVYKVARVAFTETGAPTPQTRHAMKATLMELYSLMHEPLRQHPNIVELLGLAWGSNYFDPSHRLPVLVVEYADHGNLADLQKKHDLPPATRGRLALDIGEGLEMLHRCGIIHGDVKSENILICSHPEREYIAKLSDFGFSMVGEAANDEVYVGGTRPWKAPEAKSPVPRHLLQATDIYSYGLLLWRLATDGEDPFRFWVKSSLRGDPRLQELERLKEGDYPAKNTSLDTWLIPYITSKYQDIEAELTVDWLNQALSNLQVGKKINESGPNVTSMSATSWEALMKCLGPCLRLPQTATMFSGPLLAWAKQDLFYGRVQSALEKCLSFDPSNRDLRGAIAALASGSQLDEPTPSANDIRLHMSYEHHILSWQQMRDLEPAVQSFVFNSYQQKVEGLISDGLINPPDCFVLASYYINGYGTNVNYEAARRLIDLSSVAAYDHVSSRTFVYRIHKGVDPYYVPSRAVHDNISVMAIRGSRTALIDLKEIDPPQYEWSEKILRDILAGVGANFFHEEQMLGGFSYHQWVRTFDNPEVLVRNLGNFARLADYKVNKRGDRILHLAASANRVHAIESLLDAFPSLTIDQRNDKGETPLLCACRAGQVATVTRLLELGADPSIAAPNGETCMHWLVSFKDEDIATVGAALVEKGARMREFTRQRISYSEFDGTIDVDFQLPGTPLIWAIHNDRPRIIQFLLENSPEASLCLDWAKGQPGALSPASYAAYYHHAECLELLINALNDAKLTYSMEPIITAAAHAADTFSMILRNGPRYEERLRQTLNLCLRKSNHIVFATGVGGFDTNLLYYAVSEGHDKAVEYLLSNEVKQLVESFEHPPEPCRPGAYSPDDINRPTGEDRRTPVLEAIRWNRKPLAELLISNGADVSSLAKNPFNASEMNWSGFHILATAGHNTTHVVELVSYLVDAGLSVDGHHSSSDGYTPETPFLVAVQHNAFNLATAFVEHGAHPNTLCLSSGLLSLEHPTTVLGHIIAASAQHTIPRLRYLLEECPSPEDKKATFIIEPTRQLSALHRAAWAHKSVMHRVSPSESKFLGRDEYDMVVNRDIMQELLQKWGDAEEHVNLRCRVHGRTALHLAAEAGNTMGCELLLTRNADASLRDELGLTAAELAKEAMGRLEEGGGEDGVYKRVIGMLEGFVHHKSSSTD
ncbi:kinase-like protein [Aspergillus ellipticus CBS 707.79]|uniref:Kinase-like protein n=1 Tax=Aspergillus ellipticus CBS 707.79 TaxID=1448320 RepID=A0A319DAX1_9EURO|nr:kinase-like protein [Aspergillus ellipticus CBS 707.79]